MYFMFTISVNVYNGEYCSQVVRRSTKCSQMLVKMLENAHNHAVKMLTPVENAHNQ